MTQAPEAPVEAAVPTWSPGHCAGCGEVCPATVPVGDTRLCAVCLWQLAQVQLNRETLQAGSAPVVPAPAAAAWGGPYATHALVGCEACLPTPTRWAARIAGMWLCASCVEAAGS